MRELYLRARAKINLTLDVTGKREDGYHDVEMIMQTVNLYDELWIQRIYAPTIRLHSNLKWLPRDQRNLAYQAAQLMRDTYGFTDGVYIYLKKRIPVAAGLGGGSSDAAAVLVGLNKLFNLKITQEELMALGLQLGADVPYCILRGTALATGIGEKLTALAPMPRCWVVLAKPDIYISTAQVYGNLKLENIKKRPSTQQVIEAIQKGELEEVASGLYNVLETVTGKDYEVIGQIKKFLNKHGSLGSIMSGSGPTVFGIFNDKEKARYAARQLREQNMARQVFVTTIFNEER
ncbi:MAG: 4-(cytidine 5'-diphospho)-2-C-methyl-D-erythritol kinase [Epulopiscium sp.]|nr:4-(cytidine 5'-diphospho)-2-C-methyl-D-erythritol kinase [Candidatus Epulonipiscium sp.]